LGADLVSPVFFSFFRFLGPDERPVLLCVVFGGAEESHDGEVLWGDQSGHPMGSGCLKWGDDFHNNVYIPPGYHGELVFECTCLPFLDLTNVVNLEKRLPSPQRCDP